jgi:histone deacetylase 11
MAAGGLGFSVLKNVLADGEETETAGHGVTSNAAGLIPLTYSGHYNISAFGLEHLHPFDGRKFSKIQKHLIDSGVRLPADFVKPSPLSQEQLLAVHAADYLQSLKHSTVLAKIFEVPAAAMIPAPLLEWRVLNPMRLAGGGTLVACHLALQNGLAINLGGGYHHADRDRGGGFCVYSDVPIALTLLRAEDKIKKALIIDTDAHQGNGFANILRHTSWAHVVDLFDESIYPFPKVLEDMSVPLPTRTRGDGYLTALEKAIPVAIARYQPDLIVYNAGSDVLASDPLSTLLLSPEEMRDRDLFVVSQARERGIPIAMVLAGGYSHESASAHGRSIEAILRKFDSPST